MNRTSQALRQAVYRALTSPQLTYQINNGPTQTLPVANVIPKAISLAGGLQAPMPLVAIDANTRGFRSRQLSDRDAQIRVWVVSLTGPDECTEISEAVIARLHTADQDAVDTTDLSTAGTASTLPLVVRECLLDGGSPVDYEPTTNRWYRTLRFKAVAA